MWMALKSRWLLAAVFAERPMTYLIVAWRHMATWVSVNIGLGHGLLRDGIKPLPEPMLTNCEWCIVLFASG